MFLRIGIVVALLVLAAYGIKEALPLLSGPSIVITSPADDATIPDGMVAIAGTARYTQNLTLDGGALLIDENGSFSTTLLPPHGSAILTLTARDQFGRTKTEYRTIFVP